MIDWNVVVTVRRSYERAIGILRELGAVQRTGLYNVLVMQVPDVWALLEQIAQHPPDERFFDIISHVVPVTHKLQFATAADLERTARDIVLTWAPQLAGKSVHVRMRRRGHKGELHSMDIERKVGGALLEELERRGTPGRFELADPDVVIAIETIRDEAGLALWTRTDLERYPFLRAAIERHRPPPAARAMPESAPSRSLLAATQRIAAHGQPAHPASSSELVDLLGELEPLTLQQLLATGASIDEVAEAVSAIEDEDAFGEIHHPPSSSREAAVRAILEALVLENFEERESEREIMRT